MKYIVALAVLACSLLYLYEVRSVDAPRPPAIDSAPGAEVDSAEPAAPAPRPDPRTFRISGPHTHDGLAIFLVHCDTRDDRDFITLDEGLADKSVSVTEKGEGQVGELLLENRSALPLFIQEGGRVQGGKQDRIIGASFVVPPKSGVVPVPAFCVEQHRWSSNASDEVIFFPEEGQAVGGAAFYGTGNRALASKAIRIRAKADKSQAEVWEKVAEEKALFCESMKAPTVTSSLNEALEAPAVRRRSDAAAAATLDIVRKAPDTVGVVIVMNGRIEEVDIYLGHPLLLKLHPRIVGSYAMAGMAAKPGSALACDEILRFIQQDPLRAPREERFNAHNLIQRADFTDHVRFETRYEGLRVHREWLRKE